MKQLIFILLLFTANAGFAQYYGFVNNVYPDRNGDYIVYHVNNDKKDSAIFFSLKNGERAFAFGKDDAGRNLQLAKAGITIQYELKPKLKLAARSAIDDKGRSDWYTVEYLGETIGFLEVKDYERPSGVFGDIRSKSIITWAHKNGQVHFFNMTWKTGDDNNKKFKPFRVADHKNDYYTTDFVITADGEYAYTDGKLYNIKKNKLVWDHIGKKQNKVLNAAITKDEEFIAVPNGEDRVDILKLKNGKVVKQLPPLPPAPPNHTLFHITPASDMKTYVATFRYFDKRSIYAFMVFEDGSYKQLFLGPGEGLAK